MITKAMFGNSENDNLETDFKRHHVGNFVFKYEFNDGKRDYCRAAISSSRAWKNKVFQGF